MSFNQDIILNNYKKACCTKNRDIFYNIIARLNIFDFREHLRLTPRKFIYKKCRKYSDPTWLIITYNISYKYFTKAAKLYNNDQMYVRISRLPSEIKRTVYDFIPYFYRIGFYGNFTCKILSMGAYAIYKFSEFKDLGNIQEIEQDFITAVPFTIFDVSDDSDDSDSFDDMPELID